MLVCPCTQSTTLKKLYNTFEINSRCKKRSRIEKRLKKHCHILFPCNFFEVILYFSNVFTFELLGSYISPSNKRIVRLPNRMNFYNNSKRPLTPPPLIFGKLCCKYFHKTSEKSPFIKVQTLQYKFLDWKWPPPLWNFSENSSNLVAPPFPYKCTIYAHAF